MEELLESIANFGFPIVVSTYLLVRMEKKMDDLEKAIRDLSEYIRSKK